jgi:hypothetical protein
MTHWWVGSSKIANEDCKRVSNHFLGLAERAIGDRTFFPDRIALRGEPLARV